MTMLVTTSVICALCGETSEHEIVLSTNRLGGQDLDTRTHAVGHDPLPSLVQRCPGCGYCSDDIGEVRSDIHDVVKSHSYQRQIADGAIDEVAASFLCYAMLLASQADLVQAGLAAMRAAWICDDTHSGAAAECRLRARRFVGGQRGTHRSPCSGLRTPVLRSFYWADLLRRAGDFEQSQAECTRGIQLAQSSHVLDGLAQESRLIATRRTDRQRIGAPTDSSPERRAAMDDVRFERSVPKLERVDRLGPEDEDDEVGFGGEGVGGQTDYDESNENLDNEEGEFHGECAVCGAAMYGLESEPWFRTTCPHLVAMHEPWPGSRGVAEPDSVSGMSDSADSANGLDDWGIPIYEHLVAAQRSLVKLLENDGVPAQTIMQILYQQLGPEHQAEWMSELFPRVSPLSTMYQIVTRVIDGTPGIETSRGGEDWGINSAAAPICLWAEDPKSAWAILSRRLNVAVEEATRVSEALRAIAGL